MTKHFHHKPVYGGVLTGAVASDSATPVTGKATVSVRNNPHDSHFHVENPSKTAVYAGRYGALTIDRDGNWSYVLNTANADVAALATDDTLEDAIVVRSAYNYRGSKGPSITITITGA